jgi:hypothetical protein
MSYGYKQGDMLSVTLPFVTSCPDFLQGRRRESELRCSLSWAFPSGLLQEAT